MDGNPNTPTPAHRGRSGNFTDDNPSVDARVLVVAAAYAGRWRPSFASHPGVQS